MTDESGSRSGNGRVAVVAGASGLVGASLMRQLLEEVRVGRVVSVVRKPIAPAAKLEQRVVPDFGKLDVDTIPKDIDDAYCCLGTTMKKAGSKQAFLNVDFDAVVAFARAARQAGARRFLVVSSLGADPRSVTFYLRTKGEMESAVQRLAFDSFHALRPSFLDGPRAEERAGEKLGMGVMRVATKVIGAKSRYAPIHVDVVARAMINLAFSDRFGNFVHQSEQLHELGSDVP